MPYKPFPTSTLKDVEIKNAREIHVFTDGACSGNPGPGGWGAVIYNPANDLAIDISGHGGHETTNNRMELMGAIAALEFLLDRRGPMFVALHTDSKYVYAGATEWIYKWRKNRFLLANGDPVKNEDLWRRLDDARNAHKIVRWQWMRGHEGHEFNERADRLTYSASRKAENIKG